MHANPLAAARRALDFFQSTSRTLLLVALATSGASGIAFAESPAGVNTKQQAPQVRAMADSKVSLQNGSFSSNIDFQVPAYHGIEPKLGLSYNSSSGNGFAGVGWDVQGFSVVERASPRRGSPRFSLTSNNDIFLLDGEELVASNALGGTHVAKRQRPWRITGTEGEWTVRLPDGVVMTYLPTFRSNGYTLRWGISSIADKHGNVVTYSWSCPKTGTAVLECYPNSIAYANTTVTLYRDTRTDVETFATGTTLGNRALRLNSVGVTVDGYLLRAYKLSYIYSNRTSRSLLRTVQQFSKDATIAGTNGVVSGGAALPATTITYSDATAEFAPPVAVSGSYGLSLATWQGTELYTDDFNGDGRSDMLLVYADFTVANTKAYLLLANGTGGFSNAVDITTGSGMTAALWYAARPSIVTSDFNGDGRADILARSATNVTPSFAKMLWANASGSFNTADDMTLKFGMTGAKWVSSALTLGDFDGDGRSDIIVRYTGDGSVQRADILFANRINLIDGFSTATEVTTSFGMTGSLWHGPLVLTQGDFDGDGRTDLLFRSNGSTTQVFLLMANPSAGYANPATAFNQAVDISSSYGLLASSWYNAEIVPGDYNGDGRVDLLIAAWGTSGLSYLLQGQGADAAAGSVHPYFAPASNITNAFGMSPTLWGTTSFLTGDYNGDGKTDIVARKNITATPASAHLLLGTGTGFKAQAPITSSNGMTDQKWGNADFRVSDYDGDGDDDIFVHSYAGPLNLPHVMLKASSALSNQVVAVENGYGGVTSVQYLPSSAWPSTATSAWPISRNPPRSQTVSYLSISDGRSGTLAVPTTYYYAGGAWDVAERRHLGFSQVAEVDVTGAHTDSYFFQGKEFQVGELLQSNKYNSLNQLMAVKYRAVSNLGGVDPANGPYVRNITQDHDHEYNGDASHREKGKIYTYDVYGNVLTIVDLGDTAVTGDERTTAYTYPAATGDYIVNQPSSVMVYAGATVAGTLLKQTRYSYDLQPFGSAPIRGDVTREERWLNTTGTFVATNYTYDNFGNRLTETDELNHTTTTVWTTNGLFPTSTTNALLHTTAFTWNTLCGTKASETDPNNVAMSWTYDAFCRKTLESHADGGNIQYGYVGFGTPSGQYKSEVISDGLGGSQFKVSFFDGLGREWQSYNNVPEVTESTYDARGLLSATSVPHLTTETPKWTNYTYDSVRRVTQVTAPDGSNQQFLFGDWFTTTCDELNKPKTRYRDADGNVERVREFLGKSCVLEPTYTAGIDGFDTTIAYDLLGRQTSYTDAKANASQSTFDSLDRRLTKSDPDMGTWSYTYDAKGRMLTQTDAKAQVINFTYDDIDRLLQTQSGGITLSAYSYDSTQSPNGIGRLFLVSRNSITTGDVYNSYTYDVMGRIVRDRLQVGTNSNKPGLPPVVARIYDTQYTYDGAGRVRNQTYPNGEVLTYGYDAAGRNSSLTSNLFASPIVSSAVYDARGHVTTRTLGSGVVENFGYDANRLWMNSATATLGGSTLHSLSFPRNLRGEVTARTNGVLTNGTDSWTYSYDDLRRLTTATNAGTSANSESFSYDEIGRMTGSSRLGPYYYATGPARPLHAPINVGFAGSMATLSYDANGNMTSDGVSTLVYNVENKPINVGGIAMKFDGTGKRYQVGNVITVGDIYEDDLGTATQTRYYYFNGVRLASAKGSAGTYYHGDQLNSATTLTNFAGAVISRQILSPFGRRLYTNTPNDPIGIAGQRLDATGLYHMGAREMNPSFGIFVTPDPSGAPDPLRPQTLNRYAYANNSPTNLIDPTGFDAEKPDTAYDSFSFWTHNALSVAGVVPLFGVIPDVIDLVYTAAEVPFGYSTKADLALAGVGVAATLAPVVGDGAAAAAKIAVRAARKVGGAVAEKVGRVVAKESATVVGRLAKDAAKGGRLGNEATRAHVDEVATEMEKRGWHIENGGGRYKEEYLPGPDGARRGSSYPDITATKNGKTLRVNTVDTRADGVTLTTREATNANRIRSQTGEHVLTIPKP